MPARQAAMTLRAHLRGDPAGPGRRGDPGRRLTRPTRPCDLARELPLHLVWHPHQVGYGGNQKTCYLEALQHGADVVVMLHPDGQYEPELIPRMVEPIVNGEADLVLGSRLAEPGAALPPGMPRWKYVANKALTGIENRILGTHFSEAHTGYRAYSRRLLLEVPFLRNSLDFVFDSELLMQAVALRLHGRGGPGPLPLLQGRLVGRLQDQRRLRDEDALDRRAADAAPQRPAHLAQVQEVGPAGGAPARAAPARPRRTGPRA